MIIQCPRCRTKYKLDEVLLAPEGSKVHCTRCDHVFLALPPPALPEEEEKAGRPGREVAEFLDESGPAAEAAGLGEDFLEEPEAKRGGWLKRLLVALLVVVVLAALALGLTVFLKTRDIHLDRRFLKMDLFEAAPILKRFSPAKIEPKPAAPKEPAGPKAPADPGNARINLEKVSARFLDTPEAGRVFIVEGQVKNAYGEAVSEIKLKGLVHTKTKTNALERVVYAGTVLSDEEIRGLSREVVEGLFLNPKGEDENNVNVQPGGTVPFMMVFYDLPDNLTEYTVEVISSRRGK